MNEETKKNLNFDSIETVEALIEERKEKLNAKDKIEYCKSTWQEFIEITKAYGFKCGFYKEFIGGRCPTIKFQEEEVILFHEEKGLIIYAESFGKKEVSRAILYGEVNFEGKELKSEQCKTYFLTENIGNITCFNADLSKQFDLRLDSILKTFEFSKVWSRIHFLWFLNYMENMDEYSDYEKINQQKIEAATPEVRKIIFD